MRKMKKYRRSPKPFICALLLAATAGLMAAQENVSEQRMQWWNEQKFGMFIHCGP